MRIITEGFAIDNMVNDVKDQSFSDLASFVTAAEWADYTSRLMQILNNESAEDADYLSFMWGIRDMALVSRSMLHQFIFTEAALRRIRYFLNVDNGTTSMVLEMLAAARIVYGDEKIAFETEDILMGGIIEAEKRDLAKIKELGDMSQSIRIVESAWKLKLIRPEIDMEDYFTDEFLSHVLTLIDEGSGIRDLTDGLRVWSSIRLIAPKQFAKLNVQESMFADPAYIREHRGNTSIAQYMRALAFANIVTADDVQSTEQGLILMNDHLVDMRLPSQLNY